jgi:hypothetical protein
VVEGAVRTPGDDVKERCFYILGHTGGVAADIEVGASLQPRVELFAVLLQAVLNVDFTGLVAGERGVQAGEYPVFVHSLELIFVEVVHGLALFAEEEPVIAFLTGGLAFFEEGAEGGDAGAGADHDDGHRGVFGQAEVVVGVEEDGHRRAFAGAVAEMSGGHPLAVAAVGLVADYTDGGLDVVLVHGLAGGDGVHAGGEALEDVEELLRVGDYFGEVGGEVYELASPAVLLRAGLVFGADEDLEAFDGGGQLGVLAYGAAGELADAEAGAECLFEADFDLVVVEDALAAGVVEGFEDLGYRDGAIFGDDSYGVTGGVGHAFFDGELDVAGLLLRALAGEEAVVGHGGEEGVVAGVFGRVSGGRLFFLRFLGFHFGHFSMVKRIGAKCRWIWTNCVGESVPLASFRGVSLVSSGDFVVSCSICCGDALLASSSYPLPPPPRGYFAGMPFILMSLQRVGVCKIFNTKGLPAKYWK